MTDFGFGELSDEGRCSKCGKIPAEGSWPFCPHPPKSSPMISRDEIPGGMTIENGFPEPRTFYSYSEMNRAFDEAGLYRKEVHCPTPGTDHDPAGVQNSRRYIDPYTLESAKALVARQGQPKEKEWDAVEAGVFRPGKTSVINDNLAITLQKRGERQ